MATANWAKNRELIEQKVINIGSNKARSLREISDILSSSIQGFDPKLWSWGEVEQRSNESDTFFNNSELAKELGFNLTSLKDAFKKTINYYHNL